MSLPARALQVDIVCALDRFPCVVGVYMLDARQHPDDVFIGVALRPHTVSHWTEVHYALLSMTNHQTTGRVLYVDAERPSRPLARGSQIVITDVERGVARERLEKRDAQTRHEWELEEQELARTKQRPRQLSAPFRHAPIRPSLQSSRWEIVRDPFPSEKPARRRVLVADDDPSTASRLRALDELDVVWVESGWSAIDQLLAGEFDLAIVSVKLRDMGASTIFRIVGAQQSKIAGRVALLMNHAPRAAEPPAQQRILTRPIDPNAVRAILDRTAR